mgnify:CR=1
MGLVDQEKVLQQDYWGKNMGGL